MTSDFDYDEDDLILALAIGLQVIKDADKIRLFIPDYFARFDFERKGVPFQIRVFMPANESSQE
jgi:hypothetical protein